MLARGSDAKPARGPARAGPPRRSVSRLTEVAARQSERKRLRQERIAREREAARAAARRRRRLGLVLAGFLVAGTVAAVAVVLSTGGGEVRTASGATVEDVHGAGVTATDGDLYIATHSGLFRAAAGRSTVERVPGPEQDLMGFSVAGPNRFVASGHPGPDQDLPARLGLIESTDAGRSWRPVSLQGEADFHVLRASEAAIYAFDGRLRTSRDGGRTWQDREPPGEVADLAPSPVDPDRVLVSTGDGLKLSSNGGASWRKAGLDPPALLAWRTGSDVFAIDGEARVYRSDDAGLRWRRTGKAAGPPAAFTADVRGNIYVVRGDGSADISADGGRTWRPRVRG